MQNCKDYIAEIYQSKEVNDLIGKVEPKGLQDDLRQELAITLLGYDCDKISEIWANGKLLRLACAIIANMAFSSKSQFYTKYRKSNYKKAIEYLYLSTQGVTPSTEAAKQILNRKSNGTETDHHEFLIFSTFIEMRSIPKVAQYYGVPVKHIRDIINKLRNELKSAIRSCN
jgi:hypothetical protein